MNNNNTQPRQLRKVSQKYTRQSQLAMVMHNLAKNKGAMAGLFLIAVICLVAIFADFLYDYDEVVIKVNLAEKLIAPCLEHPCGTDNMGRDILARIIHGARYSLAVGLAATVFGLIVGVFFGAIAGYYGGALEDVIMRCNDILSSIPAILMGIVIVSALGVSLPNLMMAIGITSVPQFVRITRASVLTVRNQEYIEALHATGLSEARIIGLHVLPNCLSPIIVQVTLAVGNNIISASSLSFLGVGIPVPLPEWGAMLAEGRNYIRSAPWMCIFPGLAIMMTVLALNLMGDGLRDALDPKLKR